MATGCSLSLHLNLYLSLSFALLKLLKLVNERNSFEQEEGKNTFQQVVDWIQFNSFSIAFQLKTRYDGRLLRCTAPTGHLREVQI